jgi:hypothetical protein
VRDDGKLLRVSDGDVNVLYAGTIEDAWTIPTRSCRAQRA